jgi:hypothetical protein
VGLQSKGLNFDEFKTGRLYHAVATWNLRTISAFVCRRRKTNVAEMAGRRISNPEVYKITLKISSPTSHETVRFHDNDQPVNPLSQVVTICTTCFKMPKLCNVPTQCIYVFHMVLTIKSNSFPKQHQLIGEVMFFL